MYSIALGPDLAWKVRPERALRRGTYCAVVRGTNLVSRIGRARFLHLNADKEIAPGFHILRRMGTQRDADGPERTTITYFLVRYDGARWFQLNMRVARISLGTEMALKPEYRYSVLVLPPDQRTFLDNYPNLP